MWPVELCISSLPPHLRMDADYLLLGGIWLGPVKPDMKTILQPVISKIESLKVSLKTCQGEKQLRAKLLLSVFDLPARAAAVNIMQYNGRYGCLYCLDEGKHINHRRIYLPTERRTPRNDTQMNRWARQAIARKTPICGVKGPSVLSSSISLTKAVPIDYMHAVLEGVTKSLFNSWFDTKYHQSRFYLGRKKKEIDKALLRIKPSYEFRRTPM